MNWGIIHHSFIHEAGSSNPVRVRQTVSGTTCWCWSDNDNNDWVNPSQWISLRGFLFHLPFLRPALGLALRLQILYYYLATAEHKSPPDFQNQPERQRCNKFSSYKTPLHVVPPQNSNLGFPTEKKDLGGISWKKTSLRIDLPGNSKWTQSETKRTKRTPKRTQSETKRAERTPKRNQSETKLTFSTFSWLFLKLWKSHFLLFLKQRPFKPFSWFFCWNGRASPPYQTSSFPQFVLFLGRGRLRMFFSAPGCLLLLCVPHWG